MFKKKKPQIGRRVEPQSVKSEKSAGFSYYSRRAPRPDEGRREKLPDTARPKQKTLFWNHVWTLIVAAIVIIVLGDLLWLNKTPNVTIVSSSPTTVLLRPTSVYVQAATKLIASSSLNQNKLTINVSSINDSLKKEFPEIANVTLTLGFTSHQAHIYIQPSSPVLLLNNGSGIYALDNGGVVIGQESAQTQAITKLGLPMVTDSGLPTTTGKQVLSGGDVGFIIYVYNELKAQNVIVNTMTLPPASRELDATISGKPYTVKFNLENDAKEQVGTLIDVQQYLATNKITPAQYIDVRVSGRAYYK